MNTSDQKRNFKVNLIGVNSLSLIMAVALAMFAAGNLFGQSAETNAQTTTLSQEQMQQAQILTREKADVQKFGLIAAAAAFGLGAIGAGIAIANVGSAAMGAIGEKPEIAGQALIFIALAEGLVVFGFITALMILGKI
ncbi:MAG TPA: ATP synthase subunit C [Spirochaetia bacterium]|nr:ATP synthase subunit C [Spirochaetales bacterium]HPD79644.1 ATP synthase subunit C [Spirochaetales bacterium]HQK33790.1 ATP synthase subunit C [Spirochaetales bacterium]HRS64654.1 ATP synthase subunit C [Spirochaetia bacterium]HRV27393.1 ATP synthase subunit C [Spirochaetia bacterium]